MKYHICLDKMMSSHNVKPIDLHKLTGLKKPYISKMLSGSLVPPSYSTVELIMDAIGLSLNERIILTDAYQVTRSSNDGKKLWKAFSNLYSLKYPVVKEPAAVAAADTPNAEVISGKGLYEAIRNLISGEKNGLTLFFTPSAAKSSERMCKIFKAFPDDKELTWLMPYNNDCSVDLEDLGNITNCLPLLLLKPCSVKKYAANLDTLINDCVFPFFIMSENAIIVFDKELQNGQYFNDEKVLGLYTAKYLEGTKSGNRSFMDSFDNPLMAIAHFQSELTQLGSEEFDYYTFASAPCIVFDLPKEILSEYTADAFDGNHLSSMYISLLRNIITSSTTFTDIFSCYGLKDYLDNDEFYELGKRFSKNMSRDFRRHALETFIEQASDAQEFESLGIKIPGFNVSSFIGMNIMSSGFLVLFYGFDEKTVVVTIKEKNIVDMLIKYIEELKKYGFIATKEETIDFIEKELEKRTAE